MAKNATIEPFAKIQTIQDRYKIDLSLKYFVGFKATDIKVERSGREVVIDCKKAKNDVPTNGLREVHIVYRLPEDTEPESVKMNRDGFNVHIECKRSEYGKPLSLAVCDVTKRGADVQTIGHL